MSGELSESKGAIKRYAGKEFTKSEGWLGGNRLVCDLGGRVLLGGTVPCGWDGDNICCGFPNVDGNDVAIGVVLLVAVILVVCWCGFGGVLSGGGTGGGNGLGIVVWVVSRGGCVLSRSIV